MKTILQRFYLLSALLFALCILAPDAFAADEKLRIVSQLPSLTEICFELGLGDQLVGVSDYCDWPPAAQKLPRVGGLLNPNFERVVSLKPDRVLLQGKDKNLIDKYRSLGIKTLALQTESIEDVIRSIRTVGEVFNRRAEAAALIAKIESGFKDVKKKAANKNPVSAMVVIGHDPGSLREIYVAGKGSFHNALLEMAGGKNCFDDAISAYPMASKEAIISKSPEAVILLYPKDSMSEPDIRRKKDLWVPLSNIRAVQSGNICVVHGKYVMIPGPRMARIAEEFSKCLHKED